MVVLRDGIFLVQAPEEEGSGFFLHFISRLGNGRQGGAQQGGRYQVGKADHLYISRNAPAEIPAYMIYLYSQFFYGSENSIRSFPQQ